MRYLPAGPAEPLDPADLPVHLGGFSSQLARWLRQRRPDVVHALRDLLAAPARLGAFGIAAADRAASRYSWERIGAETEAAYRHFLSRPAEPSVRRASPPAGAARRLAA